MSETGVEAIDETIVEVEGRTGSEVEGRAASEVVGRTASEVVGRAASEVGGRSIEDPTSVTGQTVVETGIVTVVRIGPPPPGHDVTSGAQEVMVCTEVV